jgi:eukaryotic-like serine/threonine-protein kinase
MIGKTISHYKILEKLGGGGMGIVYKAQDTKLDRIVALKFLPPHLLADKESEQRFISEAKAASSFDHPNICTIHDINTTEDGQFYIVMGYYKGETLKKKLESGPLQINTAINYAIQIATGLTRAHEAGIIHRDIKPANIMITDRDEVKILDFGLAKTSGDPSITKLGSTAGTVSYMSPEQTKGEKVDQRTDIWSLGVVLYQIISGSLPFKGDYDQAIIYSILNEEPALLNSLPVELEQILSRSLQKNPEDRYNNINEMLDDLKKLIQMDRHPSIDDKPSGKRNQRAFIISSVAGLIIAIVIVYLLFFNDSENSKSSVERKMIAVLPFENLGLSDDEYFAEGITGEIISKLSGLSGLGVIARASAMQYKNTQKPLRQIAEELGVQYVLEGTVQWEQSDDGRKHIRVNPELINVENSTQMWSKPYEAEFSSVFTIQSEIAVTVAEALNLKLIQSEQVNLKGTITDNSEAYDLYLKALYYSQDIANEKNCRIAEELLEKAINIDSNFAEAYAKLSTVQSRLYWEYFDRSEEILKKSKDNAQKSLVINPDLSLAHIAMGDYYYNGALDYTSALKEYNEAIKTNVNHIIDANNGIPYVLRRQGKMREALEYLKKIFILDPRNYTTIISIGETYCLLQEYERGITFLDKASQIAPEAIYPIEYKAYSYLLANGDTKKARTVILEAKDRKIGLNSHYFINLLYICDVLDGNFTGALEHIKGIRESDVQFYYKPEDLYLAETYRYMKNKTLAEKHFKAAVKILQGKIKQDPQDSRLYSSLGIAYAGLGENENAIREGNRGYELLPISKDAWRGTFRLLDLAQIYTMVGEQELALDAIEDLLKRPTDAISVALLKLDPTWEPLRGNPRYQKLVKNIK